MAARTLVQMRQSRIAAASDLVAGLDCRYEFCTSHTQWGCSHGQDGHASSRDSSEALVSSEIGRLARAAAISAISCNSVGWPPSRIASQGGLD